MYKDHDQNWMQRPDVLAEHAHLTPPLSDRPARAPLSETLRSALDRIRVLLVRAERADLEGLRARYEAGLVVAEVKRSPSKYGSRALARVAGELGLDPQVLYRCANTAECWTPEQMEALVTRTDPQGRRLTWSHFVAIARMGTAEQRADLVEEALSKGLSVRELTSQIRRTRRTSGRTTLEAIKHFARCVERRSAQGRANERGLLGQLARTSRLDAQTRSGLARAIEAQERSIARAHETLSDLRAYQEWGASSDPSRSRIVNSGQSPLDALETTARVRCVDRR